MQIELRQGQREGVFDLGFRLFVASFSEEGGDRAGSSFRELLGRRKSYRRVG